MDWAIQQIVAQWALVMSAPLILLPIGLLGLLVGWSSCWLLLREKLANRLERANFYKEKFELLERGGADTAGGQHSAIAKKLEYFWQDGTNLCQEVVHTRKERDNWMKRMDKWMRQVIDYLDSVDLAEEASMFKTLPIDPSKRHFAAAFDENHNARLNELEQRISKLRKILGRAHGRTSQ